jgi:hypothetical protein
MAQKPSGQRETDGMYEAMPLCVVRQRGPERVGPSEQFCIVTTAFTNIDTLLAQERHFCLPHQECADPSEV